MIEFHDLPDGILPSEFQSRIKIGGVHYLCHPSTPPLSTDAALLTNAALLTAAATFADALQLYRRFITRFFSYPLLLLSALVFGFFAARAVRPSKRREVFAYYTATSRLALKVPSPALSCPHPSATAGS
jgi:hypothetical protein